MLVLVDALLFSGREKKLSTLRESLWDLINQCSMAHTHGPKGQETCDLLFERDQLDIDIRFY